VADPHLWMWVAAFVGALWWTKNWLMDTMASRWRFILATLAGIPLWVVVAFLSTRVVSGSSGVGIVYASTALSYVAAIMAFVTAVGFVLGLYLWAEEEAQEAADAVPDGASPGFGD
jgi:hypothetical protein